MLSSFRRPDQKDGNQGLESGSSSSCNGSNAVTADSGKNGNRAVTPTAYDRRLLGDSELMAHLAAGDEDAAVVLTERHGAYVLKIALAILKDRGEAQDTVQESFLQLYRTAAHFDCRKGSLSTWLFLIASHAALDRKAYLQTRRFYKGLDIQKAEEESQAQSHDWLHLAPQEQVHLMDELLPKLKPAQRRAIELKFFEGLTADQAAMQTGESSSSFENNLYRGLKHLRNLVLKQRRKTE